MNALVKVYSRVTGKHFWKRSTFNTTTQRKKGSPGRKKNESLYPFYSILAPERKSVVFFLLRNEVIIFSVDTMNHRKTSNHLKSSKFAEFYRKNSSFSDRKLTTGSATSSARNLSSSTNSSRSASVEESRCEISSIRIKEDDYKVKYSSSIRKAYLEKKFREQQREKQEQVLERLSFLGTKLKNAHKEGTGNEDDSHTYKVDIRSNTMGISNKKSMDIQLPNHSSILVVADATATSSINTPGFHTQKYYCGDVTPCRDEKKSDHHYQTRFSIPYDTKFTTLSPGDINHISYQEGTQYLCDSTYENETSFSSRRRSYEYDGNAMEHRPYSANEVYSRGSYEYDGNAMENRPYSANEVLVYDSRGPHEDDGNAMENRQYSAYEVLYDSRGNAMENRPYSANEVLYDSRGSHQDDGNAMEHRSYSTNEVLVYDSRGSYEDDGDAMEHTPYLANKTPPKPKLRRRSSNYANFFSESLRTVVQMLDEAISPNQFPTKSILVNHNSSESNDISAISFNSF